MMSEERFYELTSSIDYYQIWDKQEDKGYTIEDAVDKLNSLAEENEELKKILKDVESEKEHYADLYNQCRRLKSSDESIKQAYIKQGKLIFKLEEDLQYYKTKSARLEEELLSTRC